MNDVTKLLTMLRLLLTYINMADFIYVILGFVLIAEIPDMAKQRLIDGLNEMLGRME